MEEQSKNQNSMDLQSVTQLTNMYEKQLSLNDKTQVPQIAETFKYPINPIKYNVTVLDDKYAAYILKFSQFIFTQQNWQQLIQYIKSSDIIKIHLGVIGIKKLVSIPINPPIQKLIDYGLIPLFIQFIKQNNYPQIQYEALWCLANLGSGTPQQTQQINNADGYHIFMQLLSSPSTPMVDLAIWAIGNTVGDNAQIRNKLIQNGLQMKIVTLINQKMQVDALVKNGLWLLSNICRSSPKLSFNKVQRAVFVLINFITQKQNILDQITKLEVVWAISCTQQLKNNIDKQTSDKLVLKIMEYMKQKNKSLVLACLKVLQNLFERQQLVDVFIKNKGMVILNYLLNQGSITSKKISAKLIRRIMQIPTYTLQQILVNEEIVSSLKQVFFKNTFFRRDIAYGLANMSDRQNWQQIYEFYIKQSLVKLYLAQPDLDDQMALIMLICVHKLLKLGNKKIKKHRKQIQIKIQHQQQNIPSDVINKWNFKDKLIYLLLII